MSDLAAGYSLNFGMEGLLRLIFLMLGIAIAWYGLGTVRWDVLVKHPQSGPSRLLRLIIAIILGSKLADFGMQYIQATILLKHW